MSTFALGRSRTKSQDSLRVGWVAITLLAVIISAPMAIGGLGLVGPAGVEWQHIRLYPLFDCIADTMLLAIGVTFGASVIGTALAWFTVNYEFSGSKFFS